jgi:hypothetical protein
MPIALAALIAVLGWAALGIDFDLSISASIAHGHSIAEAVFHYMRFFTNLTNIGIAVLMTASTLRLVRGQPLHPARVFDAALVYLIVTCVTYEAMLRNQWSPNHIRFFTDALLHDLIPGLTLVFWLAYAPRAPANWREAALVLIYPTVFLMGTLIAGTCGQGYPYHFLDVDKIGVPRLALVVLVFLVVFYTLALLTNGMSMRWARAGQHPD